MINTILSITTEKDVVESDNWISVLFWIFLVALVISYIAYRLSLSCRDWNNNIKPTESTKFIRSFNERNEKLK